MISTSIDLDAEGLHKGYLDVPLSLNESAWSNQRVPIVSIKSAKDGPTLLLLGGSHGDEYEGPIVLSKLIHGLMPIEGLCGQLIVLPALNTPAVQKGTRLSPLDGGNMNRTFPGDPHGTMTERLANFVTTQLIPRADVVIDLHSGGKSLAFVPCTIVPQQKTEAATARIVALAQAFNAPLTVVLKEPEVATMIDAQVEAQGKIILATELGGIGTVSPQTVAIAANGLLGVMVHLGALPEAALSLRGSGRRDHSKIVRVDGLLHYIYADDAGVFEPSADTGATIDKDAIMGRLHMVDRVDRPPVDVHAKTGGIVVCRNGQGRVQRGDLLAMIGHEVTMPAT